MNITNITLIVIAVIYMLAKAFASLVAYKQTKGERLTDVQLYVNELAKNFVAFYDANNELPNIVKRDNAVSDVQKEAKSKGVVVSKENATSAIEKAVADRRTTEPTKLLGDLTPVDD